ncbi:molybdopterin-binding aldehyde dehydrogenase-like protein [Humitalea rosea]|uniref:Molybdopterin-binding aldehyde dehydrogenase-like protein n=1 Tax=Humitalea rosea TaxID=990373 RepID=A0A2W7I1V5_9PROT|nr:molybdopterin-binding aldehyde dehydrogenase-like protein [Humitalea rosea]
MTAPAGLPASLNANRRLSQWLRLRADGRVIVTPGKVEIGQGILTALAQIVADELDVAWERVAVEAASTDTSPNEGVTSGSRSVQDSGLALRHACAAARAIHVAVIAQRSGVPREALRIEDGRFLAPDGRMVGSYWAEAASGLLDCDIPAEVTPKAPAARRIAGWAAPRLDLPDKVFGAPRYIHDLRLPGMRFARMLRPPSRGARLAAVPAAPPGARLVVDGDFLAIVCDSEAAVAAAASRLAPRIAWQERDTLPDAARLPERFKAGPIETANIASPPPAHRRPARASPERRVLPALSRPCLDRPKLRRGALVGAWRARSGGVVALPEHLWSAPRSRHDPWPGARASDRASPRRRRLLRPQWGR